MKFHAKRPNQSRDNALYMYIFRIFAGDSVHGQFVRMNRREGIEIKARQGLQSNHNTKIGKIASFQVYPDLYITNYKGNYR